MTTLFSLRNAFYTCNIALIFSLFFAIQQVDSSINNRFKQQVFIISAQQWGPLDENYNPNPYYVSPDSTDTPEQCEEEPRDTQLYHSRLVEPFGEGLRDVRINDNATTIDY